MEKIRNFFSEHKIIILFVLAIIAMAVLLLVISLRNTFSATLDILVVPFDAKVTIDGKDYKAQGVYEGLIAKTVHVDISKEGFESQSFDLELKRDETVKIYTYLKGNDEWYIENDSEEMQNALELIHEQEGNSVNGKVEEDYPILSVLPIVYEKYSNNYSEYISFRIDIGAYDGCSREYCLMITSYSGDNYERALEQIRGKGFSPEDYEILYKSDADQSEWAPVGDD